MVAVDWDRLPLEAGSFPELLVALDHALRGTPYSAKAVGTIPTPKGLLRKGVLVEGPGEVHLVLWASDPGEAEAARTLLPQALAFTPLEGARIHVYGASPSPPGRISALLDTKSLGLEVTLPRKGEELAVLWLGQGEVLPYSQAASILERWASLVGGREVEATHALLGLLGLQDYDKDAPIPPFLLPLLTPSGGRAALSYREDRGPRLHFARDVPRWEALALYANATRLLQKELLPLPKRPKAPAWAWWQEVLRRGEKETLEAVGRIRT